MSRDPNLRQIGPYVLEATLGSGGMGKVYRALDTRLERYVAVKIMHRWIADTPRARERLRREARAVARLNHPAIVQIHDVIEEPELDGIVMEWVQGEPLSRRLKKPLDLDPMLRIALSIAEGLSFAHSQNIIHRDLKPENIMILPGGSAKILDFGLAKYLETQDTWHMSLTAEGHVIGTFHAMSPEQAQGLEVDHRSDLFSLGSLLYHCATGIPPFLGKTASETLARVCVHRQAAVRDLNPAIPASLSQLIDRLLEKQPAHRVESAAEVVAALRGLASGVGETMSPGPDGATGVEWVAPDPALSAAEVKTVSASFEPAEPPLETRWSAARALALLCVPLVLAVAWILIAGAINPEKIYVVIAEPSFGQSRSHEEPILVTASVRAGLSRALLGLEGLASLTTERGDPAPAQPLDLARALAADEVITSRIDCAGAGCHVALGRVSAVDGRVLWFDDFEVPGDDLRLLSIAVERHLSEAYPDRERNRRMPSFEVEEADYVEYLRLHRAYTVGDSLGLEEIRRRLAQIRERSPRFFEGLVLEGRVAHNRFLESRDTRYLEQVVELVELARELAPNEPRPLITLFASAFESGQMELAETTHRQLAEVAPGSARLEIQQAWLEEKQGDPAGALARLRRAVDRRPSWMNLFSLARMELRQGAVAEARDRLHQALERSPGNIKCQSLLAQLELLNGDPGVAAKLYQTLAERSPGVQELSNLGVAQLLSADYAAAAETFQSLFEKEPSNPSIVLNLADAFQLLDRESEARWYYERVLALVEQDQAPPFYFITAEAQALAHLGHPVEAVATLQKALRMAPDHPQVLQEAALIYTLVGDHASALASIEAAISQGVEARWFDFPWFGPLENEASFRRIVKSAPLG